MSLCCTNYSFLSTCVVFFFLQIVSNHISALQSSLNLSDEARLIHQLIARYDRIGLLARPMRNSSVPLQVQFKLRLINMDIDEKGQALKTSAWVICRWTDEHLQWNPAEFGGIKQITLPFDKVWMPDISLVNTAETMLRERTADIEVNYKGRVYWAQHRIYNSACLIDVTNYPYDKHTCDMWFQSLSQYSWNMDLQLWPRGAWDFKTYLDSFRRTQEWKIVHNSSERVARSMDVGVQLVYSRRVSLRFSVTLKRKPGFECYIVMFPCLLLSMLTTLTFCLPPDRVDRHMLGMSVFGSFMILLLILIQMAPPSAASVPKLAIYYGVNLIVITSAVFFSAFAVNISRRGETRQAPPLCVQKILTSYLAKLLFLDGQIRILRGQESCNCGINESSMPLGYSIPMDRNGDTLESRHVLSSIEEKLNGLQKQLSSLQDDHGYFRIKGDPLSRTKTQWRLVSTAFDRICFIMFLAINIILAVALYPKP